MATDKQEYLDFFFLTCRISIRLLINRSGTDGSVA